MRSALYKIFANSELRLDTPVAQVSRLITRTHKHTKAVRQK